MRKNIDGLEYNGKAHKYYWDQTINPNATIENCLANCTTFCYGACLEYNLPAPVKTIKSANAWHKNLSNEWTYIPFDKSKLKVNDIIEWDKNHVAIVADIIDSKVMVSGSFYTGDNGKAIIDDKYDTRSFNSLEEVSDFMISNYRYRFFHYVDLDTENEWVGSEPTYILVSPNSSCEPVGRNKYIDQIETTDTNLRIRNAPSLEAPIYSHVKIGYYNVLATMEADGYTWYEIEQGKWCANITTNFLKASDENVIDELNNLVKALNEKVEALEKQNAELKVISSKYEIILADMRKIKEVANKYE